MKDRIKSFKELGPVERTAIVVLSPVWVPVAALMAILYFVLVGITGGVAMVLRSIWA